MLHSSCFHQCFSPAVGKQCRNEYCRGNIVKIILETISAECIRDLELRIYLRIGYISVGFVVVADCHRCAIGECIDVSPQYSLNGNNRLSSLCVPPILTDFKCIVLCLATFLHFSHEEKHTQHLVLSVSGKRGEIPLLLQFTLKGFPDQQPCPTMGAGASVGRLSIIQL